jgi:hypothetical protein
MAALDTHSFSSSGPRPSLEQLLRTGAKCAVDLPEELFPDDDEDDNRGDDDRERHRACGYKCQPCPEAHDGSRSA